MVDNETNHININHFSDNHKCSRHCSATTNLTRLLSTNEQDTQSFEL